MIRLDFQNFLDTKTEDFQIIRRALLTGVSSASELVDEFEEEVAKYLNVNKENVLAVNSGTSALHLALKFFAVGSLLDIAAIMPVLSFAATANASIYNNYRIMFCDVDRLNWNIKKTDINKLINDKWLSNYQKVLIPVDLYGNIFQFDVLEYSRKLKIVIDAAESFGVGRVFIDKNVFTCYSFNGNKIITTGAGGMIVGHEDNIKKLKKISIQAKDEQGYYSGIGYNYRMAGINAALGLIQLKRIDKFLKRKKRINYIYRNELQNLVKFQKTELSSYWMTSIKLPKGVDVETFRIILQDNGIGTRRVFTPLNKSDPFMDGLWYQSAYEIYQKGVCLPSSTLCNDADIKFVCDKIKEVLK